MKINYTLYLFGFFLIAVLSATINYFKSPRNVGLSVEYAKERVNEILTDTAHILRTEKYIRNQNLVATKETAIEVVEPMLFNVYGKEKILSERPYGVHKIGDYWFVSGSLSRYYDFGGGFEIIIDSRDAKVMSITHYK